MIINPSKIQTKHANRLCLAGQVSILVKKKINILLLNLSGRKRVRHQAAEFRRTIIWHYFYWLSLMVKTKKRSKILWKNLNLFDFWRKACRIKKLNRRWTEQVGVTSRTNHYVRRSYLRVANLTSSSPNRSSILNRSVVPFPCRNAQLDNEKSIKIILENCKRTCLSTVILSRRKRSIRVQSKEITYHKKIGELFFNDL